MHLFTNLDQTRHGTRDFPAQYYYVDATHPHYQMPFHWHSEWELLRVLEGSFQIQLDDEPYVAQKGDALLIRGGCLHGGLPHSCIYECLTFDLHGLFRNMDMVKPYLRPFYRQARIPISYFPAGHTVATIVGELMEGFSGNCPELETVASISRLFAAIVKGELYQENPDNSYVSSQRIDRIKSVLEYIEVNYATALSLEELAKVAGMNPKYFCRVFHSVTHQSPMDYVNFYRIEKAAHLLDSTDLSVTAVGSECGFWESSYFSKVFRKYKGITPKKYRTMHL